jgi:hypothetical protein
MIVAGVSWVLFWTLVRVFQVELAVAALVTGLVFILLGLLLGERIPTRA